MRDTAIVRQLDTLVEELDLKANRTSTERRRETAVTGSEKIAKMRIVERQGILEVEDDSIPPPGDSDRRRGAELTGKPGNLIWQRDLRQLERSEITDWLDSLDKRLTPHRGLRRWHNEQLVADSQVDRNGRILLFVHGTFSKSEAFFEGIKKSPLGNEFLQWMSRSYSQVLTFDHPTLAVSPMVNARRLGLLLDGTKARIDVISHSRGGLVTRWWLEAFDKTPLEGRRAVFVGSPLAGTGLAAPPNIRQSFNLLANIANALGDTAAALPFTTLLTGAFRVVSSVTKIMTMTPAIDAAIALVPGLAAQSRVGNQADLLCMRDGAIDPGGRYFAVRSNFESERIGWRFWRAAFRRVRDLTKDLASDMVFDGENDLVVDSKSMIDLSEKLILNGIEQVFDFGTTDRVHHTNYFEQKETLDFIRNMLDRRNHA